jgi:hypothetical protein
LPVNAVLSERSYETGWQCERGFRQQGDACIAVKVPENAYFREAFSGNSWECERGYRQAGESCEEVLVPENAHLDHSGSDWDCNPPFTRQSAQCALPR